MAKGSSGKGRRREGAIGENGQASSRGPREVSPGRAIAAADSRPRRQRKGRLESRGQSHSAGSAGQPLAALGHEGPDGFRGQRTGAAGPGRPRSGRAAAEFGARKRGAVKPFQDRAGEIGAEAGIFAKRKPERTAEGGAQASNRDRKNLGQDASAPRALEQRQRSPRRDALAARRAGKTQPGDAQARFANSAQ